MHTRRTFVAVLSFILLTAGYLLLRYALFAEVAREGQLTADGLGLARIFVGKHLQRMFFSGEIGRYPLGYIAALLLPAGVWLLVRVADASRLRPGGLVLYFGPCWWFPGLLPLIVVGSESTTHAYLASVGITRPRDSGPGRRVRDRE